ncbi:AIPR family protein [Solidesulfovibrio magneticus]|nr:AIPR family protein [Solidesulfovibrio magneticus]
MSANDLILLNQLLDLRLSEIGQGLTEEEFFEIFSAEQVLKDDDLSYEELSAGVVDGGGDGGIDSLFFFVNNVPFYDEMDVGVLKRGARLRLVLIQSKSSEGFTEVAIEKLISSARDFFDLNKKIEDLSVVYNKDVIGKVANFRNTYFALVSKFPEVHIYYAYATKGVDIHPDVERKVSVLKETIESLLSPVSFSFGFFKASDLLLSSRKSPPTTLTLKLAENPISTSQEGFVALVSLGDYLNFITDENGHLRAYLFEGNVRDYQGKTEVNGEIRRTVESVTAEDFWWLNNGVSIICSKASSGSKTLTIEDPEIVNGLQTSREIYNALQGKDLEKERRNILVRVLTPQNQESRDHIIKATNSQTPIPASSLRATDKIHRDIEDFLYSRGYYYDRRKNYYKNIGKPLKKIFGIPFVAQSVMACALSEPANARARPSSLIKKDEAYSRIFNSQYPLEIYLICPIIVQSISDIIRQCDVVDYRVHANNILFYVSALWALRHSGVPSPRISQIAHLDIEQVRAETVLPVIDIVWREYIRLGGNDQIAKGTELASVLIEKHRQEVVASFKKTAGECSG